MNDGAQGAEAAADRIRHLERHVQHRVRWDGWVWLIAAVATPAFLIGTHTGPPDGGGLSLVIAVTFGLLGATLAVLDHRRRVVGKRAARVSRPATYAYVAAMILVALASIVFDAQGPPLWFVLLAAVPVVPCLIAAWYILRP